MVTTNTTEVKENQVIAGFWDDLPNGGTQIHCSKCDKITDLPNNISWKDGKMIIAPEASEFCAHCGVEFLYPDWASW